MKTKALVVSMLAAATLLSASAIGQGRPDAATLMAAEREAMKSFAWMDGEWRGIAVSQTEGGERRVRHTERSGPLLGGTIRLIEGRAYRDDGSTGFNAFAVISYDPRAKQYHMVSYAEGNSGDFIITPTASGYVWSIPAGPMTLRYTATFANGTWTEIGERILPGKPAMRIFRMDMRRTGPSQWPAAGAVKPARRP